MTINPLDILSIGTKLIDKLFPSQEERNRALIALIELNEKGELTELTSRSDIIKAEAQSENWLTSSWRPLLMLTFGALIVCRWFGFTAPNLTEQEYLKLWDIVHLGIGGYIIGRSGEKLLPSIISTFKK